MKKLTKQRKRFVDLYLKYGNRENAYMEAYPTCKSKSTAKSNAYRLLTNDDILAYYNSCLTEAREIMKQKEEKEHNNAIADITEVMSFFTSAMRGEVKDQFDLDPALCDRLDAGKQLAKRYETVKKFEFDERKTVIAEKQAQELDDDIIYEVEEPVYEKES